MKHLSFEILFDLIKHRLPPTEQESATAHIARCAACQGDLVLARRAVQALYSPLVVEPPATLQQRVLTAWQRKQTRPAQRRSQQADLQLDRTHVAPAGVRGQSPERQLLYTLGDFDLDLHVSLDNVQGLTLRGQLLADPAQPAVALDGTELQLTHSDSTRWLGLTDQLGRFHLSYLAAGHYSLRFILDQLELVCEPLLLTA